MILIDGEENQGSAVSLTQQGTTPRPGICVINVTHLLVLYIVISMSLLKVMCITRFTQKSTRKDYVTFWWKIYRIITGLFNLFIVVIIKLRIKLFLKVQLNIFLKFLLNTLLKLLHNTFLKLLAIFLKILPLISLTLFRALSFPRSLPDFVPFLFAVYLLPMLLTIKLYQLPVHID